MKFIFIISKILPSIKTDVSINFKDVSFEISFLFSLGFDRIESSHDPNNPYSGKVMEKCGLIYEGRLRKADYNNQGIVDSCVYGILREDFEK